MTYPLARSQLLIRANWKQPNYCSTNYGVFACQSAFFFFSLSRFSIHLCALAQNLNGFVHFDAIVFAIRFVSIFHLCFDFCHIFFLQFVAIAKECIFYKFETIKMYFVQMNYVCNVLCDRLMRNDYVISSVEENIWGVSDFRCIEEEGAIVQVCFRLPSIFSIKFGKKQELWPIKKKKKTITMHSSVSTLYGLSKNDLVADHEHKFIFVVQ